MVEFYSHSKLNDKITAIKSMTGEIMYLVEGENKAVLIDTCLGVGNLKSYVDNLTTKPIEVILTHGHVDHALGAPEFDVVYMNKEDISVYKEMSPLEERKGYIQGNLGGVLPNFDPSEYVAPQMIDFKDLKDGDVFDLGEITLEIYSLAGHTKGTMVVLIPEEKTLIIGDACNTATFLFDKNSLTVEEYKSNLIELEEKINSKYEKVFAMHHEIELPKNIIKNVVEVCNTILKGEADDIPFEFMGHTNYIAKAVGERFIRLDDGFGNIIYNKGKVHKNELLRD